MKKTVINLAISQPARDRLRQLADESGLPMGVVLESAIMAYQLSTSETSETSDNDLQALIDAALQPILERLAALESRLDALVDTDVDMLVNRVNQQSAQMNAVLADMRLHLLALEKRKEAAQGEPASMPIVAANPAEIASETLLDRVDDMPLFPESDELACLAEPSPNITDAPDTPISSGETNADEAESPAVEDAHLVGDITLPDSVFTGVNRERNRRILELHKQGLGTSQISRELIAAGIQNSKENSIKFFLDKHGITPNKVKAK